MSRPLLGVRQAIGTIEPHLPGTRPVAWPVIDVATLPKKHPIPWRRVQDLLGVAEVIAGEVDVRAGGIECGTGRERRLQAPGKV
jgi:hypothetical protein